MPSRWPSDSKRQNLESGLQMTQVQIRHIQGVFFSTIQPVLYWLGETYFMNKFPTQIKVYGELHT